MTNTQIDKHAASKLLAKNIIHTIRNIRIEKKISQETVAGAIGISQNAYSKIELGRTRCQLEMLICMMETLDITFKDLSRAVKKNDTKPGS